MVVWPPEKLDGFFAGDIALISTTVILFSARLTVRLRYFKRLFLDDWLMIVAMITSAVQILLDIVMNRYTKALYDGKFPITHLNTILTGVTVESFFYAISIAFSKLSFGVFFLKLFTRSQKWQRTSIKVLVTLDTVTAAVWAIICISTCAIPSYVTSSQGRDCAVTTPFRRFTVWYLLLSGITGLYLSALSVHTLIRLPLSTMLKASAMFLVAFSCVGSVSSIVRVKQVIAIDVTAIARWGVIEAALYIMSGSAITLRPLILALWDSMRGTRSKIAKVTDSIKPLRNLNLTNLTNLTTMAMTTVDTAMDDLGEGGSVGEGEIRKTKTTVIEIIDLDKDELARSRDLHYYWLFGPLQHNHSEGWVGSAPPPN